MKCVVARHCETHYNAQGRIQGHVDIPLNATGRAQAARLADDVKGHGITGIWCSDLVRAIQTARTVSVATGAPFTVDTRLRECGFGSLEGVSFVEFALRCGPRNFPVAQYVLQADFTPFGGERGQDVHDRQVALMNELKAGNPAGTVMIIGHGRSLRTLLAPLGHPYAWLRNQGSHIVIDY